MLLMGLTVASRVKKKTNKTTLLTEREKQQSLKQVEYGFQIDVLDEDDSECPAIILLKAGFYTDGINSHLKVQTD